MLDDLKVTPEQGKAIADLKVQAMMFSMGIDWETCSLIQIKAVAKDPFWLTNWKEKINISDRQPGDYEGGEDGR